jgi:dTDP-4-amino-4,6-dideoxygalactose transaminase
MDRAEGILARRRDLAEQYDERLREIPWLISPVVPPEHVHGYQSYVCLFAPEPLAPVRIGDLNRRRNGLMQRLEEMGIATRQGTHAPVLQGYYAHKYEIAPDAFPNAIAADRLSISLPLYPQMTEADLERVVDGLRLAFEA